MSVAVAGIGQHHALRNASLTRSPNLLEGDFWLGLKLNRFRHAGLLPPLAVFDPRLRQIQAVRHRHTRLFRGHRKTDRHPAVILFADLAAILPGHSYRLTTLLRKSGVIHHPCHHRVTAQHGRDHEIQTAIQHRLVTPGGVGDHMMQRLVHAAHVVGSQAARPSARRSSVRRAATGQCNSSSAERDDRHALRLRPGPRYMPQSVVPVGLAQSLCPQNNSTLNCLFITQ